MLGQLLDLIRPVRLSVDEQIIKNAAEMAPDSAGMMELAMGTGVGKPRLLSTAEILECYGKPGNPDNLTTIEPPYQMFIAWDPSDRVEKISCHKKIALPLMNVLNDIKASYTAEQIRQYGFDQFGGCMNHRPQRGLEKKYAAAIAAKNYKLAYTYLSRHSWAKAIDLDPNRNALKTKAPKAGFSKPECKVFGDIFYKHGFIGYGRERGNDWMHWEIGILIP